MTIALFAVLLTIYVISPVTTSSDSRWSIHTAMSIARGHGGDLSEYLPVLKKNDFYAIEYPDGKPRTLFPIGTSLLALPLVVVDSWIDPSLQSRLTVEVPFRLEKAIASIFGAIAGCLFFWIIFCQFESLRIALASTIIFCIGTSMWSTATRALWQHGPLVMMQVIAMLLLLRARQRPQLIQFVSLPLAMAYLVRPTAMVPIIAISAYVLLYYRQWFIRYVAWAIPIAVPWIAYNFSIYGMPFSHYYWHDPTTHNFLTGVLANLFSPSRGLFVFSPVLLFAASGFVIAWRDRSQRPLNIVFGIIAVGEVLLVGMVSNWWGGAAFGTRYLTDAVPFFAYFTAFNFRLPATVQASRRGALAAAVGAFALVSIVINAQGALRPATLMWNVVPRNIDDDPSRVWDWRDPQFARTNAANAALLRH